MRKRVVITGYGIYSCIGRNRQEVLDSLLQGRSGIVLSEERKKHGYRSGLTGRVERPDLRNLLDRRSRMMLPEQGEYAYVSTLEALAHARLDGLMLGSEGTGIIFGNDSSAKAVVEASKIIAETGDTMMAGSGAVFQTMNSTVTMNLATIFAIKGINFTISAACASGSHAIGIALSLIRSGMQDCIICGGAQETNDHSMGTFDAISAFSCRENEPAKASRPFDRDRDGLVPSGGAATLVLESYDSAVRRGAPIIAEVTGYGFSSNGGHISHPNVEGPVAALRRALQDADLTADQVDYINAHATSTPVGDASEARALTEVFGGSGVPVTSTKSMTGHECWMAGASEVVYSLLMMENNFVAPNINLENPDESARGLNIPVTALSREINIFLSNSFGFGGTNSSLIVQKWRK